MTGWRRRGLLLPLYLSFLLLSSSPGCAPPGAPVAVSPGTAGAGKGTGEPPVLVYVGMAGGDLDVFHLDAESGHLSRRGSVSVGRSPSSLVRSADREVLIATDEATGTATAMAINSRTGGLRTVGRSATGGLQPTGATLDRTGHYLLVANRGSGNVSVLALKTGGALEAIETFPAGLGADAVAVHPANDLAFVANLRAATISQYKFNTGTGMLTPKPGPPLKLPPRLGTDTPRLPSVGAVGLHLERDQRHHRRARRGRRHSRALVAGVANRLYVAERISRRQEPPR